MRGDFYKETKDVYFAVDSKDESTVLSPLFFSEEGVNDFMRDSNSNYTIESKTLEYNY